MTVTWKMEMAVKVTAPLSKMVGIVIPIHGDFVPP